MGPGEKKLTDEEIAEQEELVEVMLNEEDFICVPDEYDEEMDDAILQEERALLDKYGF